MRRQAMHEDGIGLGIAEQLSVHLEGREDALTLISLTFLSHAGPNVGVDHIGVACGLQGIVRHRTSRAGLFASSRRPTDRGTVRPLILWCSAPHAHPPFA